MFASKVKALRFLSELRKWRLGIFELSLLFQGQIKVAKRRVVMASLYLGTGPLEQELVRFKGRWSWWQLQITLEPQGGSAVSRQRVALSWPPSMASSCSCGPDPGVCQEDRGGGVGSSPPGLPALLASVCLTLHRDPEPPAQRSGLLSDFAWPVG